MFADFAWITTADAPHTPFTGWLTLWDSIRAVCVLGGLVMIVQLPAALARCRRWSQRARFISYGLYGLLIMVGSTARMGDYADMRLLLQLVATGYAVAGLYGFRSEDPVPTSGRSQDAR